MTADRKRIVIVTGAGIGIGAATAKAFGALGDHVVVTDILEKEGRETVAAIADAGIALKRMGKPDDVAELVTFLATSNPCFITGQDIVVDGFQFNR